MRGGKRLTREIVIRALVEALRSLDYVHAFFEGGAAAFNRVDEWSDIDVYVVVDDDKVAVTFGAVEGALRSLSGIKQKYDVPQTGWPGVSQAFYRLEDTSEYLVIDLAVLKLSSPEKFLEPEIHGEAVFYFNKSSKVKPPPLNRKALAKKLRERLERLKARFDMFNIFVQKEINRDNGLEAIDLYHAITLASLVEALRIQHNPLHHDFRTRYIHHELPPKIVQNLEHLHFVKGNRDLQQKYRKATTWFHETVSEIDQKEALL
jgi:hypothetical protein